MSIPKTERIVLSPRTKEERVAIALEYLSSFVIWTEYLDKEELKHLKQKVEKLIHPSSAQNLNQFLEGCVTYIAEEDRE